jgi:kynurenine formamidase
MRIVDLTQTIVHNMQVYPGDQSPTLVKTHNIPSSGYTNHQLTTGMHAGTHIDGPWHMIDNHALIAYVPLSTFIGKACVIDIRGREIFSDAEMIRKKAAGCTIVLFFTGYGAWFGTEKYLSNYPVLADNVAHVLADMQIKLIGIDALSPDNEPHETHKILLQNNVLIAENLVNLHLLLCEPKFEVVALPIKIAADSAPARIVAIIK